VKINYFATLSGLITNNYTLVLAGSSGVIITAILLLLLKKKSTGLTYSQVVRTLNRDFKIGLSQVEKITDLEVKQELILKGSQDLQQEIYFQVLDILVDGQSLRQLLQQVTEADIETKKRTARTLLKIGTPQAVDYAVPLLYDDQAEVKILVINKLAELQNNKAVSILVNYLEYCNDVLIQENLIGAFKTLGSKSVPHLLKLVKQGSKHRNWIIELLGDIGGEEVIDSLLAILAESPAEKERISIVKSLTHFPDHPEVFSALVDQVEDNSCNVRAQVAKLLRKFDQEEVYSYLDKLLRDSSGLVRQKAAESLLESGRKGIKYLVSAIEEGVTSEEVVSCLERVNTVKLISIVKEEHQNQVQKGDSATLEIVDQDESDQKLIG